MGTLTDKAVRTAKPRAKVYFMHDERGLIVEVSPRGSKHWRVRYFFPKGRERRISVGEYPAVSLKEARQHRDEIRALAAKGIDL